MNWLQALILGALQGLTEFLPVSSTAHLRIVPALLGWEDPGAAFTAVTQWGTWLATVIYFRRDIARLTLAFLDGVFFGQPFATQDSRLAWMIAAATVPIVVFGLLLRKYIVGPFRSLNVIAAALIGLALLLLLAEVLAARRRRQGHLAKDLEHIGWTEALLVGLAQTIALVPGASRSGSTITGALFVGLDRPTAARFSFLLSLPAIFGAGLYGLVKDRKELLGSTEGALNLLIATVVAGVVGYLSIAFLIDFLKKHTTGVFIVYRIALGILLLVLVARGVVPAVEPEKESPEASGAGHRLPPHASSNWLNSR